MRSRFRKSAVVRVAVTALLLGGCSHVPVSTMYRLATFDPARADPAQLRVALRYPDALAVRKDGAKVTLTLPPSGIAGSPQTFDFILVPADGPGEREPRLRYAKSGYTVEVMRLSDGDVATIRKLQSERRGSGGNIAVSAAACHRSGLPVGAILTSTYLRLDVSQGYMTVLEDLDLRKELSADKLAAEVPAC